MEIIPIHYNVSSQVDKFADIEEDANKMLELLDSGKEISGYPAAYAIAHSQVSEVPKRFFVVASKYTTVDKDADFEKAWWKSKFIINPHIVEIPEEIEIDLPTQAGKKAEVEMRKNEYMPEEGCLSFPNKKPKKVKRAFVVKVSYQIPVKGKLETIEESIEGLKAHIFQHEVQHLDGQNIFYDGPKE